jgi:AcrR family transcriptional regulator
MNELTTTRGRPRTFDADKALDKALAVFWRKGYEGASLPDLTKAMGINRPSMYAAFGNKEQLFRKALDRYSTGPAGYACAALNEPTAREVVEKLFRGAIESQSNPRTPRGCLMVQGAMACGDEAQPIQKELIARRCAAEKALAKRFARAVKEGDLPRQINPADLAGFIVTVLRGMAIQSASGATADQLKRIANTAMRAWPERK